MSNGQLIGNQRMHLIVTVFKTGSHHSHEQHFLPNIQEEYYVGVKSTLIAPDEMLQLMEL